MPVPAAAADSRRGCRWGRPSFRHGSWSFAVTDLAGERIEDQQTRPHEPADEHVDVLLGRPLPVPVVQQDPAARQGRQQSIVQVGQTGRREQGQIGTKPQLGTGNSQPAGQISWVALVSGPRRCTVNLSQVRANAIMEEPLAAEAKLVAASQLADHTRCTSGSPPATASKTSPTGGSLDGPGSPRLRPGSQADGCGHG